MSRLYARTNAEAHLFMDLRPCGCGDLEFDRQSAVISDGGALCTRYAGPCRSCGAVRTFVFELPESIRPIRRDQVEFGGDDPSRLLDPGEWMEVADYFARLEPCTRDTLDLARAAVEEILKLVPAGADRVPDEVFRTERGRAVRDTDAGRFGRAELEAIVGSYRDLLAKAPAPAAPEPRGEASGQAPEAAAPAERPLDEYPLQVLVEAFAKVLAKQQGFEGVELRRHVSDLKGQVQSLVQMFEIKAAEERQRRQTTAEVERLLAGIAQTGTAAGRAIAAHREIIAQAFDGVDLARIADGLQVLVEWLRNPTDDQSAQVQELIASLQAAMGPVAGSDPEREDEARREQIRKDVRASVEQIVRGKDEQRA
jgi:hypothetical protein